MGRTGAGSRLVMDGGHRRLGRALAALGAAAFLLFGPAAPAVAQTGDDDPTDPNAIFDCAADIVDVAAVLDDEAVAAAGASVDATIIVRTIDTVPAEVDLATLIDEIVIECFADGGEVRGDLAFFSVAVDDRVTDVFLGPDMPGGSIPQDLNDTMTARFADGDFTGGVIAAIEELDLLLAEMVTFDDPDAGGPTDEAATDEPATDEAVDGAGTDEAVDGAGTDGGGDDADDGDDGGGAGLGTVVTAGALVVGGAGAGGWTLARRRARLRERRAALRSAAAQPQIEVGALREQSQRLEIQADLWSKTVSGRTTEKLLDLRHRARSAASETERAVALFGAATPDGIDEASSTELVAAEGRLTELRAVLERTEDTVDSLAAFGARLDHLRNALPAKRDLLLEELDEADELADERAAAGFPVDEPRTRLDEVEAALASIDLEDFAPDLLAISERLESTEATLFAADHDLAALPDREAALVEWRSRQGEAVAMERRRIEAARGLVTTMAAAHHEDSWRWVADYPNAAGGHLDEAEQLAAASVPLADQHALDDAGRQLEQAGLRLAAADDLLDQLEDLAVDLANALTEAPGIVAEARMVADRFGTFVERHRGDMTAELRGRPATVDLEIEALVAELAKPRPNHLRVAEIGDRLNQELDEHLAAAVEQQERMEALRRQAAREVARAQRSVQRARQSLGWQLFPSSEARELDGLEGQLGRLPTHVEERIRVARSLGDRADAVQERIIARRRRNNSWAVGAGSARAGRRSGGSSRRSSSSRGRSRSSGGRSFSRGGSSGRSFRGGRGRGRF
ncbi:MAG: hypothetical protein AAGE88_02975 [Actinomycetota bacterium]